MHPCLTIDEILREIFCRAEERRTLCAIAQTCRTFNGPATDLIWETLPNLTPVLRLLSSVRVKNEDVDGTPPVSTIFKLFILKTTEKTVPSGHCRTAIQQTGKK